ncbi:MAG TPA: type III pantothenate kinase [Limnochordales bacterium]
MLLAVDIGNTTTGLAVYAGEQLVHHWWLTTVRERTADELAVLLASLLRLNSLAPTDITGAAISSVVPSQTGPWERVCRTFLGREPLVVTASTPVGVTVGYRFPEELGPDRLVNAVAAVQLYGAPVIVVDFGTATTFDVVDASGCYLGGAIAPGVGISAEALFERAARLPRVELRKPPAAIGRTTAESIQSGIVFGFAGQVDGLVRRLVRELGGSARVVATGGLAELIAPECETVEAINPLLTLEGLRLIHQRLAAGGGHGS